MLPGDSELGDGGTTGWTITVGIPYGMFNKPRAMIGGARITLVRPDIIEPDDTVINCLRFLTVLGDICSWNDILGNSLLVGVVGLFSTDDIPTPIPSRRFEQ
jgi:hypothetical protein